MQINGLQSASSIHSLAGTQRTKSASPTEATAASPSITTDELELSAEAQALSDVQATSGAESVSGMRMDKINSIRQPSLTGLMRHPKNCRLLWTVCSIHSLRSVSSGAGVARTGFAPG